MDPLQDYHLGLTRRRFFGQAASTFGAALGTTALASLLGGDARAERPTAPGDPDVIPSLRGPHFAPKAKRVIYMHMEGAPSQLDLYDYKPDLRKRYDQDLVVEEMSRWMSGRDGGITAAVRDKAKAALSAATSR